MTSPTPPLAGSAEPTPEEVQGLAALATSRHAPVADGAPRADQGRTGRSGRRAERGDGRRRRSPNPHRKPPSAFWRWGFPVVMVLLVLAIPLLILNGINVLLQSTDGKIEVGNRNESEPGYTAVTPPTPTMLVEQVDDAGKLTGITVLAQTGERVGGVVFLPLSTSPAVGQAPLDKVFADGGQDKLTAAVQELLGAGMGEVQVIDPGQWKSLMGAVGPLQFTSPEAVDVPFVGTFPKGDITLEPADVGVYLGTPSASGDDVNRLQRNDAFWHALLSKLESNPVTLPGDEDKGLTKMLPALAKAQVDVEVLPVRPVPTVDRKGTLYLPDDPSVQALMARLVPFPTEARPGGRVKVRVLDGTGKLKNGVGATPALVKAGAQVTGIGNANNFDYKTTQIIFYDDSQKDLADKMRVALGAGELAKSADPTHDEDITIILGADFAANPASTDSVITTPPSVVGTVPVTGSGGKGG